MTGVPNCSIINFTSGITQYLSGWVKENEMVTFPDMALSSIVSHGVCQYALRFTEPLCSSKASFIPSTSYRGQPRSLELLGSCRISQLDGSCAFYRSPREFRRERKNYRVTNQCSGCQPPTTLFLVHCEQRYSVARQVSKHPIKSKIYII